jgi:hypothetical protein
MITYTTARVDPDVYKRCKPPIRAAFQPFLPQTPRQWLIYKFGNFVSMKA